MAESIFGTKVKNLITLPPEKNDWHIELNIVDWGHGNQIDLRKWGPDGKMSKGLTLSKEEALLLIKNITEEDLL